MYGGIDQLVDTYKVNPQPLNEKVQKAQQGQPPGAIPPDLEEALALQQIAKLRQNAQNQQAMQAGGAQQSVVDKLKQMLGGVQQQGQMAQAPQGAPMQGAPAPQGQPVMAARGGSIDQLMSNLGRHYAGGGIIAFNGKDQSKVPTEEELEAQRKADREKIDAIARVLGETGGEYAGKSMAALTDIAALVPRGLAGAVDTAFVRPARALGANIDYLSPALTPGNQSSDTMTPFYDRYIRAKEGTAPASAEAKGPATVATPLSDIRGQLNAADAARFAEKPAPKPPAASATPDAPRPTTGSPTAGKPSTGGPAAPAAPAASAEKTDPDNLDAITRKYLKGEFAINPETERDKAVEWSKKTMGLDALLAEKERRANEREAMIKQIQGERTPTWIKALQRAGNAKPGSGVGELLAQMGAGNIAARESYENQDLAFQKELAQLRDVITDAKISGNKELVKEGMAAYKEVDARRRAAAQSSASLLNTDATNAMRLQTAREGAANRAQIAAAQLQARKSEAQQRQQNWIAEQERKWQDTLSKSPAYKEAVNLRSMYERQLNMSTNPKIQEQAQAAIDIQNEKIAKMLPTAGGGTAVAATKPQSASTTGTKVIDFNKI